MSSLHPTRRFALLLAVAAVTLLASHRTAVAAERRLLADAVFLARAAVDTGLRTWHDDSVAAARQATDYGLHLAEDWQRLAANHPERPLVVLIHGFNSTPERNQPILAPVRAAGLPTAVFAYPNDSPLAESAQLLSKELKAFAAGNPRQQVALLTHSMGGLIARACVENSALDPGNVSRLVMIAPPTHGTLLAPLGVAADLWEHGFGRTSGDCWTRWCDSFADGVAEAAIDLQPGSTFLTALNARPRNPRVRYSIFLGSRAAMPRPALALARDALRAAGRGEVPSSYLAAADGMLKDMDELVDGQGDGVVAVKRGRLDGVVDTVVLPFDHLSCTGKPADDAVRELQLAVLARLN